MKAYSIDLRERVVTAYETGKGSIEQVAKMFSVSEGFVKKMLRQKRETNSLSPLPHGGGRQKSLSRKGRQMLQSKVRLQPDATLFELKEHLEKKAIIIVSESTISRELARLGLPRKKSLSRQVNATTTKGRGIGDE